MAGKKKVLMKLIKALIFGIIFILFFLVVLSVILYFIDINQNIVDICFYIITIIGVLISSILCSKNSLNKGWLMGIIAALCMYLIINGLTYIVSSPCDIMILIKKLPLYIATGLIGGCIGINLK
jgi:putative membrane protein (TIGR04086 family)